MSEKKEGVEGTGEQIYIQITLCLSFPLQICLFLFSVGF